MRADSVMNLRKELEKLGSVKGLTHQEKGLFANCSIHNENDGH